jgi:cytidine deaminase
MKNKTNFTPEENKLILHAKKRLLQIFKMRKSKNLYDNLISFVLSESGKIYEGCPLECIQPNANCCAERIAIANMVINETEKVKIKCILVADAIPENSSFKPTVPCGVCRSVITEFATKNTFILCTSYIRHKKGWTIFEKIDKYEPNKLYPFPYQPIKWD